MRIPSISIICETIHWWQWNGNGNTELTLYSLCILWGQNIWTSAVVSSRVGHRRPWLMDSTNQRLTEGPGWVTEWNSPCVHVYAFKFIVVQWTLRNTLLGDSTKPGLWTLDWTLDSRFSLEL